MNTKLQTLLERQEQIANLIREEKAKDAKRERKLDTRRKVLVGALVHEMMEKDPSMKADITKRLETYLVRRIDRELFGFAVSDEEKDGDQSHQQKASAA